MRLGESWGALPDMVVNPEGLLSGAVALRIGLWFVARDDGKLCEEGFIGAVEAWLDERSVWRGICGWC